mmetsp:Transcript_11309/g.16932  ORF Transcript_11309/g.16932 Transcript_11309/m.16932 type:complete len:357 (+) Transcript_11309:737-1807(+)
MKILLSIFLNLTRFTECLEAPIAVVGGASRGIGKGIAIELGKTGYTVYCLGRTRGSGLSIDSTVEEIEKHTKGKGIALGVDVLDDKKLFEIRDEICQKHESIQVLVCSTFAVPSSDPAKFRDDFWLQGMEIWDCCHGAGLRAYYALMCAFVPLLMKSTRQRPLIALISSFGGKAYTFNVAYGVGKAAVDRLASDAAIQLAPYNVDIISLYPGVVRTERNLDLEASGKWKQASGGLDLSLAESPGLSGKALLALLELSNEDRSAISGSVQVVAEVARQFSIKDENNIDPPPSIRSIRFIIPNFLLSDSALDEMNLQPLALSFLRTLRNSIPDILLPWSVFSSGPPPVSNIAETSRSD